MPFKSKSQRSFLFANHPKMAKEWSHKTDMTDMKSLPEKKGKKQSLRDLVRKKLGRK